MSPLPNLVRHLYILFGKLFRSSAHFKNIIFLITLVCVCLSVYECMCTCKYPQSPEECVGSLGGIGSYNLCDMLLGTDLGLLQ